MYICIYTYTCVSYIHVFYCLSSIGGSGSHAPASASKRSAVARRCTSRAARASSVDAADISIEIITLLLLLIIIIIPIIMITIAIIVIITITINSSNNIIKHIAINIQYNIATNKLSM